MDDLASVNATRCPSHVFSRHRALIRPRRSARSRVGAVGAGAGRPPLDHRRADGDRTGLGPHPADAIGYVLVDNAGVMSGGLESADDVAKDRAARIVVG